MSGQAICCGRNDLGQLGSVQAAAGHLGDFNLLPVPVDNAAATMLIEAKGPKTCLLNLAGRAFCIGNYTVMELGTATRHLCHGRKPCNSPPLEVQTSQVFISLPASQFATCGLTARPGADPAVQVFSISPGSPPQLQLQAVMRLAGAGKANRTASTPPRICV